MYTCILRISQFMSDFKMKPKPFNMLLTQKTYFLTAIIQFERKWLNYVKN